MAKTIQDIFTFDANLIQNVLWQYDNAAVLKSLVNSKNEWYSENLNGFWQQIIDDFLNINTANDWGLNLWGRILKVKRLYNVNGQQISLSTELYRRLILGKIQLIRSNGTIPEINKYLNFVFSPYITPTAFAAFAQDVYDMRIVYVLNFEPSDEELALIYSREMLPTPAGVEDKIYLMPESAIFGFDGSGFQPWNQAPFWDGRYI